MPFRQFAPKEKFIERELSWLKFNERVLDESTDPTNPILERIKFLAIFVNNLDEFFMVRVAGLLNLIASDFKQKNAYGYYAQELYNEIKINADQLIQKLYEIYRLKIQELKKSDIYIKKYRELNREQQKFIQRYFDTTLYPIMTPMAVDQGHPFPVLPSKTMAFAVHVMRNKEIHLAILPIPQNINRLIKLPPSKNEYSYILVDEVIRFHLAKFFKGYKIKGFSLFRVMRDSELEVDEEFTDDLLQAIDQEVKKRTRAKVVYLEAEGAIPKDLLEMLCSGLHFPQDRVVMVPSDFDLTFLFQIHQDAARSDLCYPGYIPAKIPYDNIFQRINENDFISHVPYQSFYPTVDLISSAAKDENVLAIKMTLYRTNRHSAIVHALKEAAQNKKQVTVLVELKARFDEENNIRWARELEDVGCHVIYGIPGVKIHSKMTLIVRKEEGQIRRYVHLATGNYNERTARLYTDIGYFTSNEDFAKDVSDVFNIITGYSLPTPWKRIISSPNNMRDHFFSLIDREIYYHKRYQNGSIQAKMNSLEDPLIIEKLYEASCAGVKAHLIIRGICCLVPGIKNLSDNIHIRSIVGRFLEHTRIFIFNNNNTPRVFLSSADWMRRNFDKRIELTFEIYKDDIREHLIDIVQLCLKDTAKSRILQPDGSYIRPSQDGQAFNMQDYLISFYGRS